MALFRAWQHPAVAMSDSEGTEASTSVRASVGKEMSVTVVVGDEDGVAVTGKGGGGCSSAGVRGSVRALAIVSRRGGRNITDGARDSEAAPRR